jgi:signal transduction histidine kinase
MTSVLPASVLVVAIAATLVALTRHRVGGRSAAPRHPDQSAWMARLFDSNAAALAMVHLPTTSIVKANDAFTALIGTSDSWIAALASATAVEVEVVRNHARPARVSISVIRAEHSSEEAMIVVSDVTERWLAEMALEHAREILDARTRELDHLVDRASETAEELRRSEANRGQALTVLEERQRAVTMLAERLAAANRELEAFSYSVSHDLRTPLRGIDSFARILFERYGSVLDDRGRDYLTRVRNATKRMSRLIDDLLKLARISKSAVRRQRIDLGRESRSVMDRLREADPERDVTFLADGDLVISGDPHLMRIVLENLLGNAWKFTSRRAHATIAIGRRAEDGAIFVRDDGAGFDMRYSGALFGPFQRLHTATEFEGTGIGLATVERILSMHGGSITATAAVDQGATFYFSVPDPGRAETDHRITGDPT